MCRFISLLLVGGMAVLCAVMASAATIHVPADQPTIQAGINAAVNGDTVLVAGGIYSENVDFYSKSIVLRSEHGPQVTYLKPLVITSPTVLISGSSAAGAEIEGFSITGGGSFASVDCQNGSLAVVRGNIFTGGYAGPYGHAAVRVINDHPYITRNVIATQPRSRGIGVFSGSATIINNTIHRNTDGILFSSFQGLDAVVLNNIITLNSELGITERPNRAEFNDVWGNGHNYQCDFCYPNNMSVNPLFLNPSEPEFGVRRSSPCVDAGDANPEFNDPDGSRNDIGALPIPSDTPYAWSMRVSPIERFHVTASDPQITWRIEPDIVAQQGFEIEVGTDADWLMAEMWSPGVVNSSYQRVQYSGTSLQDGAVYFLRLRINVAGVWGGWRTTLFRANTSPSRPVPQSPIDGAQVYAFPLELAVANGSDADGDSLKYEFVVYEDSTLSTPVDSRTLVREDSGVTSSGVFNPLPTGTRLWWRSRVSDQFEWSEWSDSAVFQTNTPRVRDVPVDYATIQEGIDSAAYLDTVLVAPGAYYEILNFKGRRAKLITSGGPAVTHLYPPNDHDIMVWFGTGETRDAELSGFTVHGTSRQVIFIQPGSSPVIARNVFRDYGGSDWEPVVVASWGDNPVVTENLFINNGGIGCVGIYLGTMLITNNTFVGNSRGLFSINGRGDVYNNIIANSAEYGLHGTFTTQHHNDVWGNSPDYDGGAGAAQDNLSQDPWFCDAPSEGFSLSAISPCVNAGQSGSNIGAFGVGCGKPLGCECPCHADPECDSIANILDVVLTIGRAFGAEDPDYDSSCIYYPVLVDGRTDVDCNGYTDIVDVVHVISVVLRAASPATTYCHRCLP